VDIPVAVPQALLDSSGAKEKQRPASQVSEPERERDIYRQRDRQIGREGEREEEESRKVRRWCVILSLGFQLLLAGSGRKRGRICN